MTPESVAPFLTCADLDRALADFGLSIRDVACQRIDAESFLPEGRLVLVVTAYARDAEGRRYIDHEDRTKAATEVRRFLLTGDLCLAPNTAAPPTRTQGESNG